MASSVRLPPALASLLEAGRSLVSQAPSAQVNMGRLDGVVRPELVPPPVRRAVMAGIERMLEATSEPMSPKEVEKLLKSAWDDPPGKVLDEIDLDEPLAVRPHAQTHRAVVAGDPVAVKVARPRVAAAARSDLMLLDALARPLGAAFPALDTGPLLREVRERVLDELDLEHEADVHRRVARGLRRMDGVIVAAVNTDLTTHDVHVSDLLEGPTLADTTPDDPGAVARTLVKVYAGAPRAIGVVLANARANDIVLLPGGGIGLIGPGAARKVETGRLEATIAVVEALAARDEDAFTRTLGEGGLDVLPEDAARAGYEHIEEILGPLLLNGPARLDADALAVAGELALDRIGALMDIAAKGTPQPADVWPGRSLGQVTALLASLEAEEEWLTLTLDALRSGWR